MSETCKFLYAKGRGSNLFYYCKLRKTKDRDLFCYYLENERKCSNFKELKKEINK